MAKKLEGHSLTFNSGLLNIRNQGWGRSSVAGHVLIGRLRPGSIPNTSGGKEEEEEEEKQFKL